MEFGDVDDVLDNPRHPYTAGLLAAVPDVHAHRGEPLVAIGGQPPDLGDLPAGCSFTPRCPHAAPLCATASMALDRAEHGSACIRAQEVCP